MSEDLEEKTSVRDRIKNRAHQVSDWWNGDSYSAELARQLAIGSIVAIAGGVIHKKIVESHEEPQIRYLVRRGEKEYLHEHPEDFDALDHNPDETEDE